jgi:hypothetical protein
MVPAAVVAAAGGGGMVLNTGGVIVSAPATVSVVWTCSVKVAGGAD